MPRIFAAFGVADVARGRMLDQAFASSTRLRRLPRDARLAYCYILPHVDREGRHCAEPFVLMATIFRHTGYTLTEVITCVAQLAAAGLLHLYADSDNAALLELDRFHEFNHPNRKEAPSRYPSSDQGEPLRDFDLAAAFERAVDSFNRTDQDTSLPNTPAMHVGSHVQGTGNARAMHVQGTWGPTYNGTERNTGGAQTAPPEDTTHNPQAGDRAESAAPQPDIEKHAETHPAENPKTQRRPLPREVTEYLERGKAQRAANPLPPHLQRPYPWEQRAQQRPLIQPTEPLDPLVDPLADEDPLGW